MRLNKLRASELIYIYASGHQELRRMVGDMVRPLRKVRAVAGTRTPSGSFAFSQRSGQKSPTLHTDHHARLRPTR